MMPRGAPAGISSAPIAIGGRGGGGREHGGEALRAAPFGGSDSALGTRHDRAGTRGTASPRDTGASGADNGHGWPDAVDFGGVDGDEPAGGVGGPTLARQLSTSWTEPRGLLDYERHMRPAFIQGFLQKRSRVDKRQWKMRYFVLDGEYLRYYRRRVAEPSPPSFPGEMHAARVGEEGVPARRTASSSAIPIRAGAGAQGGASPVHARRIASEGGRTALAATADASPTAAELESGYEQCGLIPLHDITSLKTTDAYGPTGFALRTQRRQYDLLAGSKEERNTWLFGFHSSIASFIHSVMRYHHHEAAAAAALGGAGAPGGAAPGAAGSGAGSDSGPLSASDDEGATPRSGRSGRGGRGRRRGADFDDSSAADRGGGGADAALALGFDLEGATAGFGALGIGDGAAEGDEEDEPLGPPMHIASSMPVGLYGAGGSSSVPATSGMPQGMGMGMGMGMGGGGGGGVGGGGDGGFGRGIPSGPVPLARAVTAPQPPRPSTGGRAMPPRPPAYFDGKGGQWQSDARHGGGDEYGASHGSSPGDGWPSDRSDADGEQRRDRRFARASSLSSHDSDRAYDRDGADDADDADMFFPGDDMTMPSAVAPAPHSRTPSDSRGSLSLGIGERERAPPLPIATNGHSRRHSPAHAAATEPPASPIAVATPQPAGGEAEAGADAAADAAPASERWVPPSVRRRMEAERLKAQGASGADATNGSAPADAADDAAPAPATPTKWVPPSVRRRMEAEAAARARGEAPDASATGGAGRGGDAYDDDDDDGSSGLDAPPPPRERSGSLGHALRAGVFGGTGSHMHGHWSAQGTRPSMEDAHVAIDDATDLLHEDAATALLASLEARTPGYAAETASRPPVSVYAVYDGHAGRGAADFASQHLHKLALSHARLFAEPEAALGHACRECDGAYLAKHDEDPEDREFAAGSTALLVVRMGHRVFTCNVGDCRAVLCRGGAAVVLSEEHSPASETERARIEAAGGWVTEERELCFNKLHHMDLEDDTIRRKAEKAIKWLTIARINGELAVSRAFGDANYKGHRKDTYDWLWPGKDATPRTFSADLVVSEPDVDVTELQAGDAFIILACDGVWEVLESQEAVDLVAKALDDAEDKASAPVHAARKLVEYALRLGSSDNVTALVVLVDPESA